MKRLGDKKTITVLGLGNLLMGDESVGIHVIHQLEKQYTGENIHVVDGGTGGLNLLEYFIHSDLVVIVDATCDGQPPGTIEHRRPRFSSDYPRTLVAHDLGLKDLLDAVDLLDLRPDLLLFTISIPEPKKVSLELSPEVRTAVLPAARRIRDFVKSFVE
jgi:hydrogenase maturation protease